MNKTLSIHYHSVRIARWFVVLGILIVQFPLVSTSERQCTAYEREKSTESIAMLSAHTPLHHFRNQKDSITLAGASSECIVVTKRFEEKLLTTYKPKTDPMELSGNAIKNPVEYDTRVLINQGIKKNSAFYPIILKASSRYQVDPNLVRAIIMAESGFNPSAVSKKGAKGLMQLMPKTAQQLGITDSFNPEHNIDGGVRYFKQLLDRFNGETELALAAYNAGSRYVRQYQGVPPFKDTQCYIEKVLSYYQSYSRQIPPKEADV